MNDFDRAMKELQQGNYSDGMVILEKMLENDPGNIDILYNLGMCYSEIGMVNKSIEVLKKCTNLNPKFPNALVALGFSYNRAGDDEKAMDMLQKALELEPDNYYALKNIGALYNKRGEPDRAIDTFKKANELMPNMPEVWLGQAQAYELKKDFDTATDYYKKAKSPGVPDVIERKAIEGLNRIAMAQLKQEGQDDRADAIMYCLSAIELFANTSQDKVKVIAFEIAMLGKGGLSINDPEKKYTLKSLDGEFTGLQLVCYMFVGFKIVDKNLPPVADLENEYQQALKLYRRRLDEN